MIALQLKTAPVAPKGTSFRTMVMADANTTETAINELLANVASMQTSGAVPAWSAGGTYVIGSVVYSPISFHNYRNKTGAIGTDPSGDTTNWQLIEFSSQFAQVETTITAAASLTAAHSGQNIPVDDGAAAFDITLPSPATGMRYTMQGKGAGTYQVGLTFTGNLYLPDGTIVAAGTWAGMNLSKKGNLLELVCLDGANWMVSNVQGEWNNTNLLNYLATVPVPIAPATSAEHAVRLDQVPYSFRNAFINGDDQINQVAQGAAVTITAGAAINYATDQWYVQSTGQNITAQQVAGPAPFQYAYKLAAGAIGPTTTLFGTRIEGRDCVKFVNQTMACQVGIIGDAARTVTWTAYYANAVDNFATKTQIATGTISATTGQATYTFTFNAGANAGNGLCIEFTTGVLDNSTGYITYSGRQLEKVVSGATSGTAFEFVPYETQLRWAQRYLPCFDSTGTTDYITNGGINSTSMGMFVLRFPTLVRVPPTGYVVRALSHISLDDVVTSITPVTAIVISGSGLSAIKLNVTGTGTPYVAGRPAQLSFNNAAGQLYFTGAQL